MALVACGGPEEPDTSLDAYGTPTTTSTTEPVSYTDTPYDFTGTTPIQDLYGLIDQSAFVWYGTSPDYTYPANAPCDERGNEIVSVPELPTEIEGIVTLHPRYFQKITFCGSDQRFYGSYFIQDSSGGFLILKDSRIADFVMGDRVKLKVTGLLKYFDSYAVLTHEDEEVVSRGHDVYTEFIGDRELSAADIGKTVTVRRELASDATNYNFSEMCLVEIGQPYSACDPSCVANEQCLGSVLVSLDREIEQRDPLVFHQGDILEITGPVVNSFGLRLLVARTGQISVVEE